MGAINIKINNKIQNYITESEAENILNEVDGGKIIFVQSKTGICYILSKNTSGSNFHMIKITENGLEPWTSPDSRTRMINKLSNRDFCKIDGNLDINLITENKVIL